MAEEYITRTLWYLKDGEKADLAEPELLEQSSSIVILGEAGIGKTSLLKRLAADSRHVFCTANQLINHPKLHQLFGAAPVLVIDALDEVSSALPGDALNSLLRKLCELDCPRFVLSCRVSDWRSATGVTSIRELCAIEPLELHLNPFGVLDIKAYLITRFGEERANQVVEHFYARGLTELLGNPQTLEMIARVAQSGNLPNSRSELFAQAVVELYREHNDRKIFDIQLSKDVALDAAGAACAALILTGSEVISRKAAANLAKEELSLTEVAQFVVGNEITLILGSRLFKAQGGDRFNYIHRRVGEYLAAQWLAKQADTPRKRRRLMAMFHHNGLVPASLRGLHAWLAQDPFLRADVIAADPMGVIEYGDADTLSPSDARTLLHTLAALLKINPEAIGWGNYAIRSLAHPNLVNELKQLIIAPNTEFRLQLLILDSLAGSAIAGEYTDELKDILLNKNAFFAARKAAGKALAELQGGPKWKDILVSLNSYQDEDSARLAVELLDDIGYDKVSDQLIGDLVMSYIQIDSRTIGTFIDLERNLPDHRLVGFLDHLAVQVNFLGEQGSEPKNDVLSDFIIHLIIRALNTNKVTAKKLWSWLEPLDPYAGYQTEQKRQLANIIKVDDELRRQVQRLVLLESANEQNVYLRMHYLRQSSSGFIPSNQDVVALLAALDPEKTESECWQQVVRLVDHDCEKGIEVRAAAARFTLDNPEHLTWLEMLTEPKTATYSAEQEKIQTEREQRRATKRAEERNYFADHIEQVRKGEFAVIAHLAKAYLGLLIDIPKGLSAHQRIEVRLGSEVAEAALLGFEAFLMYELSQPTAQEVAQSLAEDKYYESSYILVAALTERLRKSITLSDVSSDRLMVGLFEIFRSDITKRAGIEDLKPAVIQMLKLRGEWENALRLFYEPQLAANKTYVPLHQLMECEKDGALATYLATEWLERFTNVTATLEKELIDRLIRSKKFADLSRTANNRIASVDAERRYSWLAISLLANFEQTVEKLVSQSIEPELLWSLRDRTEGNRYSRDVAISLDVAQRLWIITTFRTLWPLSDRPSGVMVGSKNKWHASSYLTDLIYQLGSDLDEEAGEVLLQLNQIEDSYTETIRSTIAERIRLQVESSYQPPALASIKAIISDDTPRSNEDLLAFMLHELETVQAKINSDDVDSWRGFYNEKVEPLGEELCRHHLLGLLRQETIGVDLRPETHAAANKKVDITCSVGSLQLPIEIKGQWHRELWTATDTQLDRLYTPDWRAGGLGIYLVFWFGDQVPDKDKLKGPKRGTPKPSTPEQLGELLTAESKAAREGRVKVVVLDLTRPSNIQQ